MKMYKRIFGVLLCLCMLLGAVSLASATEDGGTTEGGQTEGGTTEGSQTHENHPICGATHTDIGDHTGDKCSTPAWTEWNGMNASSGNDDISYNSGVAYVYLSKDVSIEYSLTIAGGKTLYLCLNGKTITKTSEDGTFGGAIVVKEGGKLVLCDCKPSGNEGSITHGADIEGRGVRVGGNQDGVNTVFLMYGGKISGNYVGTDDPGMDGAGVQIQNATFKMYGGEISDNHVKKAGNYGGGGVNVYSDGTFTMYGGKISGNTVNGNDGGGVAAFNADFKMYGGTITGNAAGNMGGGVYVGRKNPVLSGGSITGNTCGANANGGGVGTYNCGAILFSGNVQITGNVKGGTITNGTLSGGTANNFYLPSGTYITITDELTGSARIGVTTENTPGVGGVKYVTIVSSGSKESLQKLVTNGVLSYENKNEDGSPIGLFTKSNRYSTSLRACSHDFSQWAYSDTQHWKKCANCDVEDAVNKTDHSGGTATCTEPKTCTVCNQQYGNSLGHEYTVLQKDESGHWYKCSRCDVEDTANKKEHSGGTATCTEKAVCTTCGQSYGNVDATNHDFEHGTYLYDNTQHWKKCSRCDVTDTKSAHTGGTATCTEAKTCTVCNQQYGNSLGHEYTVLQKDETYHWHECSRCNVKDAEISHTYNQEVVASGYLKTEATCKQYSVYYKSCICGAKGTDTFEDVNGGKNPAIHAGTPGAGWTGADGTKHWKQWSCCGAQVSGTDEAHNGTKWTVGEVTTSATCTTTGVRTYTCEDCGYTKTETIPANGHDFENGTYVYDDTQHWKKCAKCDAEDTDHKTNHTEVIDKAKPATTTETGLTEGKHCDVCGKVLVAQEVTPKLPLRYYYNSTTTTTKDTIKKDNTKSPGTFDPGVGVYALTAVLSVTGMAWVGRKKH